MDQRKIGGFLRELRNEKNLTQEELAEKMFVSGRTVSRWETGANMPDISVIIELAEFYDVSVSEIVHGERKSEKMNEEVKETAMSVKDYAEEINKRMKKRLLLLTVIGILGFITFAILNFSGLMANNSLLDDIGSACLGFAFGILIVLALYLSGILGMMKARFRMSK